MTRKNKTLRPSRSDGVETRARILEIAGALFAVSGFAETSSKEIAAQAGVDLASINYHFGNRSGLYQAVLSEAHRRLISMEFLEEVSASPLSASEKLRQIIDGMVATLEDRQGWYCRVLGRELLSPTSHLQVLQQIDVFPKIRVLLSVLSEITEIPMDDPALLRCAISVAAPCAMVLVVGDNSPIAAEAMSSTPREELAAHLYDFAMGGLSEIRRLAVR